MKRTYWTAEQIAELTSRYPHERTENIALSIGRNLHSVYNKAFQMGLEKSPEFKASPASGRTNGKQGIGTRFKSGQAAWNKGLKGLDIGGKATRFQPGQKPLNTWRPIGTERVNKDGLLVRKVADTGVKKADWKPVHVIAWEEVNGPVPAGKVVIFADGNRRNFDYDNLECLTRAELMQRNTVHRYPPEVQQTIQLMGALNRQINKRSSK